MRRANLALPRAAILLVALGAGPRASAQLPAFPGAQGFGALAAGGRGGEVFHVNTLSNGNTGTYEGPNGFNRGTLRWCLLTETSSLPRTIVFDVGGQITLTSQITIENSNMTVAGQTAPGQGVSTQARPWLLESGNHLVIRHIRNRLGKGNGQDSMGVEGGSNIIFDHVTSTWSNDEALSVAKDGTLVTVQNSLIYEGLNHSGHGYGSLIRPDIDSKVSYHHNLYANNLSRNPRPGTYNSRTLDFDFRNNVI
jgi:pectate lyase